MMFLAIILVSVQFSTVLPDPVVREQIGCAEGEPLVGMFVGGIKEHKNNLQIAEAKYFYSIHFLLFTTHAYILSLMLKLYRISIVVF